MRVKICGINSEAAFDAAVEAGADWVGLNFFPASPRAVSPERAKSLSSRSRGGPLRVGLFVDPTDADIDRVLDALPLDALQLYAPAARAAGVRARVGLPVWRAIAVSGPADLPREREDV
ncbi:MAG: N-(5'-phosphoribosyl)anthranilate isomerase, partial [Acetobacteraceae bacterium]|nr:N-(5'-phosphoribosyl)anthranilate isomerase [Acetobacteraceae bacterium]